MLYCSLLPPSPISLLKRPLQKQIIAQCMLLSFCLLSSYYLLGVDNIESLLSQPGTGRRTQNESGLKDEDLRKSLLGACRVIVSFAAKTMSAIVPVLQGGRVLHAERACFRLIIYSWFSFHVAAAEISTEENSLVRFVIKSLIFYVLPLFVSPWRVHIQLPLHDCCVSATLSSVRSSAVD